MGDGTLFPASALLHRCGRPRESLRGDHRVAPKEEGERVVVHPPPPTMESGPVNCR